MDNLDHTFDSRLREEFGQLDVRFNEAHWARLDAALSATPQLTFFQKHRRVIVLLFLLLLASAVLLMVYMPGAMNAKRFRPAAHKLNLSVQSSSNTQTRQTNHNNKNTAGMQASPGKKTTQAVEGGQSVLIVPPVTAIDSTYAADSIAAKRKADSLLQLKKKKKIHLIW